MSPYLRSSLVFILLKLNLSVLITLSSSPESLFGDGDLLLNRSILGTYCVLELAPTLLILYGYLE